jgi:hypothetical protein
MQIYLAGPIRHSPDPVTWREEIEETYDDYDFLNPLDWGEYTDEVAPDEVVDKDLETLEWGADALLCRWENVATAGSPMEMIYASEVFNIPVVVLKKEPDMDLSPWVRQHADFVTDYVDYAITYLEGYDHGKES